MKKQQGFTIIEMMVCIVFIFGAVGWGNNISKIINTGFDVFTGMMIARIIGVFMAPLGAVLGYL